MSSPTPQKYEFCPKHMKPSIGPARCNECFAPNTNPETAPASTLASPVSSQSEPPKPAPPIVTDPDAKKMIEAAQSYAQTVETVAIISAQVRDVSETLASLKQKLKETKKSAKEKLEIMQGKKKRKPRQKEAPVE